MAKLGVLLIIFSVIYLVVTIFSPDIVAPLAPLYCPAGQKLKSQTVTYSSHPGETDLNNYYHCVNSDNIVQSDVSAPVTITVMGGFVVFLLAGIALTTFGARKLRVSMRTNSTYVYSTSNSSGNMGGVTNWNTRANAANEQVLSDLQAGLKQGVIRFGGQEIHVDDLRSGNYQMNAMSDSKRTLADTLRQLEDAHTQGLINDDEYQKLRQEALDKLV